MIGPDVPVLTAVPFEISVAIVTVVPILVAIAPRFGLLANKTRSKDLSCLPNVEANTAALVSVWILNAIVGEFVSC